MFSSFTAWHAALAWRRTHGKGKNRIGTLRIPSSFHCSLLMLILPTVPEPYEYFHACARSRDNATRFIEVHCAHFDGRMFGRHQHFHPPALADKIVPVVVLSILGGGDLPEDDEAGER